MKKNTTDYSFVDTYCHINMIIKEHDSVVLSPHEILSAQLIIDEAQQAQVTQIINVGTNLIESLNCLNLARQYPSCTAAVGLHPNDCTENFKEDIRELKKYTKNKNANHIVAIGECGMDFHYPGYNKQRQADAFKMQIELALEHNLPVIVHTRDAIDETLTILSSFRDQSLRGVIHCFSEGIDIATTVMEMGFMIGIGGTITYPKNEYLRMILKTAGLSHVVLETDAPYLSPQVVRGKKNYPKNIALIAQFISELLELPIQQVAHITTHNAQQLFLLKDHNLIA